MSRAPRILIVATKNIRENPFREVRLAEAFAASGAEPVLALAGKRLSTFGYAAGDVDAPPLRGVHAVYTNSVGEYRRLARKADAVLLGCWRDNKMLVRLAMALGKLVIEYDSVSGLDDWSFGSHALLLKGDFLRRISEANYRPLYPEMRFEAPGSIAHELPASEQIPDREAFCARYSLDPTRRIAVFFPKGIKVFEDKLRMWFPDRGEAYNAWYLERYAAICSAAREAGMNLIVKLHPSAYASYRTRRDVEYRFWERFPWARILEPEDTYACYRHADVGLSIVSHSALDFGYFRKPFVYVDADRAPLPARIEENIRKGRCTLPKGPSLLWESGRAYDRPVHFPSWVGAACRADELADLLASGGYEDPDPEHYDRFIAEFWHRADGKAAERIAAYTLTALEGHRPRLRVRDLARLTWRIWRERVRA